MSDSALEEILALLRANPIDFTGPPEATRTAFETLFAEAPRPEGVAYEPADVGGICGLWCRPSNARPGTAILYLHGGAYVVGSSNAYAALAGALALETEAPVFVPDYRLAPEHPYPAAVDDAVDCYRALAQLAPRQVAVAGDSAGGGLAMALLLRLKEADTEQPAAAVLWSPWLNLACDSRSYTARQASDATLTTAGLSASAELYVGKSIPATPEVRPLQANLEGLAPILIQMGSIEILLDDATQLAAAAAEAGVPTQLQVYPGMPHVFQSFAGMLDEGRRAMRDSATFINDALSASDYR